MERTLNQATVASTTQYLLGFAAPSERKLVSDLAADCESVPELRSLGHVLLSLAANDLRGVMTLALARRAFLVEACVAAGAAATETSELALWHVEFERRITAAARSLPAHVRSRPERDDDPLGYFLYLATRPDGGRERVASFLVPVCYRALRRQLLKSRGEEGDVTGIEDLPNQLAILIRFFPSDRMAGERTIHGSITRKDLRRAFEAYRLSDKGFAEVETRERYERQTAEALGLAEHPVADDERSSERFMTLDESAKLALGFAPRERVITEDDTDDEGRSLGLLVYPEAVEGDADHPYERSQRISFGSWRSGNNPRATWRWTVRERRVVVPNELRRLGALLDGWSRTPAGARQSLLVWLALVTALPVKRVLSLRLLPADFDTERLTALAATLPEESPVFLSLKLGVVLATPTHDIDDTTRLMTGAAYRPRAPFVVLDIGARGRHYIAASFGTRSSTSESIGNFVFPKGKTGRAMLLDELGNFLAKACAAVTPDHDPMTWTKLTASLRPYSVAAGCTPLVHALGGGRPTRPMRTILHYVAYDVYRFLADHRRSVKHIEEVISGEAVPQGEARDQGDESPVCTLAGMDGCLGAAYAPRIGLPAAAWRAIAERSGTALPSSALAEWLPAATLRGGYALMAATGIRAQELPNLRREQLDLDAGLLRVEGKQSAYLREAREIALCRFAIEELRRYVCLTAHLASSGSGGMIFVAPCDGGVRQLDPGVLDHLVDELGLGVETPFSLRTLRHALRTQLHDQGAEFEPVNEAFGHVTMEETITHRLSGSYISKSHRAFSGASQKAVSELLELR